MAVSQYTAVAWAVVGWAVVDMTFNTMASFRFLSSFHNANGTDYLAVSTSIMMTTTVDLWLLAVARDFAMVYWLVQALKNIRLKSATLLNVTYYVILMTLQLTWMYAWVKLLLFSDNDDLLHDKWRQAQVGWTCSACILSALVLRSARHRYFNPASQQQMAEEKRALLEESFPDYDPTKQKKTKDSATVLCQLAKASKPDLHLALASATFLLGNVVCEILVPHYIGRVIDGLIIDKSEQAFRTAVSCLAGVAACLLVCNWTQTWLFYAFIARLTKRLRSMLFASIISQDLDFFDENETGDLVSRLLNDVAVLADTLTIGFTQCVKGIFCTVGVTLFMAENSWRLSLLMVISIPAIATSSMFYGAIMKGLGKSSQTMMAAMGEKAAEDFANVRTVRSFAMEVREAEEFYAKIVLLYGNGIKEAWAHSCFLTLALLFQSSTEVCVLFYGGHLVQEGILSGGKLVSFVIYLGMVSKSIQVMNAMFGAITRGVGASYVFFQHMARKPRFRDKGSITKSDVQGEIVFKNVCFTYTSRPHHQVLNNLSFRVRPGEVVALVGPSGGGKSTCMSLLQNFYQPCAGHVLLDGVDVHRYAPSCLHSKMALVSQEPVLFSRSIRENITYGLEDVPDADVISASQQANMHEFICSMSKRYDTAVGERGVQMSGGQKQRLAIARALIRRPAVLLLDEATSALDTVSEAKIRDMVLSSAKGRTVLIIAHRLSSVEKADRVLVLQKGRVVEGGSPSELLSRGGHFASLAHHQLLRTDSCSQLFFDPEVASFDDGTYADVDSDETLPASVSVPAEKPCSFRSTLGVGYEPMHSYA